MPRHSSSKHKSKHDGGGGQWSEWVWSDEHRRYYCYRTKRNGELEYQWQELAEPQDAATPRQQAEVDQLAAGVGSLSMSAESAESSYDDYSYGTEGGASEEPAYVPETSSRSRSGRSGKGKAAVYEADADPQPEPEPEPEPEPHMPLDPFYGARRDALQGAYQSGPSAQESQPLAVDERYPDQPNGYGHDQPAYDTSTGYTNDTRQDDYGYGNTEGSSAYVPDDYDQGEPVLGTPSLADEGDHIAGTEGDYEQLDPRFRVERSLKFQPGTIFKILWPEPMGGKGAFTQAVMKGPYGEDFYVGIRRFVVVANDEGHSNCVPILTYGRKGCLKAGVKPRMHGIVYTGRRPHAISGEPPLGCKEVKARLIEGETLSKESRINYAKICTVEHNVKVFLIGNIAKDDLRVFSRSIDDCWQQKQLQYQSGGY